MFTGIQSEPLVASAQRLCERIHAPMQWVRATRKAIACQVAFDISLIAGYVGSKQKGKSLSRLQCSLLGDLSTEMEFERESEADAMINDYERTYSTTWKTTKPQLPSVRLSIFRKCDLGFGTDYAQQYRSFLLQVATAVLETSESLSSEQQNECLKEIDTLLIQHSTGVVEECRGIEGRLELAEALQMKISKLSLSVLNNLEFAPEFIWLDKREVAIEYLLRTLAVEVVSLNLQHIDARLSFLDTIAPCLAIFGSSADRVAHLEALLNWRPESGAGAEVSREPDEELAPSMWVELIAFSNRTAERELQTLALKLLFQFGSELLNVSTNLNQDELNWQSTVLEALAEAALRSEQVLLE
jgi:hypothetical protein